MIRRVVAFSLTLVSLSALAACSDGAPSELTRTPPPRSASGETNSGDVTGDGGAAPPASTDPDLFAGEPTFENPPPTVTAADRHASKGVNPADPGRQSCLASQCHAGNSRPFAFGLTVCADAKCKKRSAGVEVRVRGADGALFAATTGDDGNAWFPDNGKLVFPARAAMRKEGVVKSMHEDLIPGSNAGSCNASGCHGPSTPGTLPDGSVDVTLFLP